MPKKVLDIKEKSDPKTESVKTNAPATTQTLISGLLIVSLAAFGWSFWSYQNVKKDLAILKDPQLASELSQKETSELIGKLSKLMVVPADRDPVVAVINDVEMLAATQDFYVPAHNGDKLIMFQDSRKAVIYDEDDNRIVNVGPIYFDNGDGATSTDPAIVADRLNIELRNGSTTQGVAVDLRDRLQANYAFNIIKMAKAGKTDYSGFTLVDKTNGSKNSLVESLQKELGATVVKDVPSGEPNTTAEILIIVGN